MAIRVTETLHFVRDFDAAVEHYTKALGWTCIQREDWGFAWFQLPGEGRAGIVRADLWAPDATSDAPLPRPRLAFQTDDIVGELARLRSRGVTTSDVQGPPGGMRTACFEDLDGNEFFLWDDGTWAELQAVAESRTTVDELNTARAPGDVAANQTDAASS